MDRGFPLNSADCFLFMLINSMPRCVSVVSPAGRECACPPEVQQTLRLWRLPQGFPLHGRQVPTANLPSLWTSSVCCWSSCSPPLPLPPSLFLSASAICPPLSVSLFIFGFSVSLFTPFLFSSFSTSFYFLSYLLPSHFLSTSACRSIRFYCFPFSYPLTLVTLFIFIRSILVYVPGHLF